jgi:ubiquitin
MEEVKGSGAGKYQKLISKDEKVKDNEKISHAVEEASIQMDSDIFTAKKAISAAKRSVETVACMVPFDSSAVLEAEQEVEVAEDTHKRLVAMKAEYFG